ncbi:hypothetical protein Tco_1386011 [Tanacetum coccineum]
MYIPFHHIIYNDLEYYVVVWLSRKYSTSVTKTTAADYGHIKWIEDLVPNSMWSQMIVKYRQNSDPLGISQLGQKAKTVLCIATLRGSSYVRPNSKRTELLQSLRHEDMVASSRARKSDKLNIEERIAFNVSLRMFTRSVVIQRRVEDLQLGVESYQKKLNLTKPDTYRSNLRRQDAYTPYSDPRGFIYENKDKKNRLMRIDELHKFMRCTLDDVRTAPNDRLQGI